ncbi:alpha/beta fold hydrolase [Accumulibacter sp.]|uniref:alpha/beta fold hydrolase n=1 Tax=Accumulibacter sp. TaxID=2053492 RepID=UPI0028C3FBD1|nr:alpha/beta fold hydrolase [Accumulibacter sp.]
MTAAGERLLLGEVPALMVRPADGATPLPTVIWFHGLGADKALHLPELQRFADAGLLAVGVDAVGHGERRLPDFEQRFSRSPGESSDLFNSLVAQTVAELPGLIDALVARGLSDGERIAVAGVSMGGCIVYGAISVDRRVRAAVAVLGSPAWLQLSEANFPGARFFPTALLSITAEQDSVVPPAAARALHDKLAPYYRQEPDRLGYRVIAGESHFMQAAEWDSAIGQAGVWLGRFVS